MDGGADAPDAPGLIPVDPRFSPFCDALRELALARVTRCRGFPRQAALHFLNVDICAGWNASLAEGKMAFDATSIESCLAALQALSCDADTKPAACEAVLRGLVVPGDVAPPPTFPTPSYEPANCNTVRDFMMFSECAGPSTYCRPGVKFPCRGLCAARAPLDQFCDGGRDTVLFSSLTPGFRCTTNPPSGGYCPTVLCAEGLYCTATSQCARKKTSGDTCGGDAECGPDLYCSGTCLAKRASGACSRYGECLGPAACDLVTGTCVSPPRPGDRCTVGNRECLPGGGLYCGADGTCQVHSGIAEACQCLPTGFCQAPGGEGAGCLLGFCDVSLAAPICKPYTECVSNAECGANGYCKFEAVTGRRLCLQCP